MKKILIGAISLIIIAGIGYFSFVYNKQSSQTANTNQQSSSKSNQSKNSTTQTSLKELLAGGPKKCTYDNGQATGTAYIANNKSRMETAITSQGATTKVIAITDGSFVYSWMDGQAVGNKVPMSQTSSSPSTQNSDINTQWDYTCSDWSVDASKFAIPTNITFTDIGAFKFPTGN